MKKVLTCCALCAILLQIPVPSHGEVPLAGALLRLLQTNIERGVIKSSGVKEPGPFVMAVVYYLDGQERRGAASFIKGLVWNNVSSQAGIEGVLDGIRGVAVSEADRLAAMERSDIAAKIAAFPDFLLTTSHLERWQNAMVHGNSVEVKGEEVRELSSVSPIGQFVDVAALERKDEVVPLLNVVHGRPGAKVFLDDELVGEARLGEYLFEGLKPGLHVIAIRDRFDEGVARVFVNPARKADRGYDQIQIKMERGRFDLQIDLAVAGQRVYLDESCLGTTPLKCAVPAGEYDLCIEGDWVDGYRQRLTGLAGETLALRPEPGFRGALVLEGEMPATAILRIDGAEVEWAMRRIYLSPGQHAVRIDDPIFEPIQDTVTIAPGEVNYYRPEVNFFTGAFESERMPEGVEMRFDGDPAAAGSGEPVAVRGIVIGEHVVTLKTPYRAEPLVYRVNIGRDDTIRMPLPIGALRLQGVPGGVQVWLGERKLISQPESSRAAGEMRVAGLPAGSYVVSVRGLMISHDPVQVVVHEGGETEVQLDVQLEGMLDLHVAAPPPSSPGYQVEVRRESSEAVLSQLYAVEATESLWLPEGSYVVEGWIADDVGPAFNRTVFVGYGQHERVDIGELGYSRGFRLQALDTQIAEIKERYETERKARRKLDIRSWLSLTTGAGLGGLTVWLWWKSEEAYFYYRTTTSSSEATRYRGLTQMFDILKYSSAATGALLVTLPVAWFSKGPRPRRTLRELRGLNAEQESLRGEGAKQ